MYIEKENVYKIVSYLQEKNGIYKDTILEILYKYNINIIIYQFLLIRQEIEKKDVKRYNR